MFIRWIEFLIIVNQLTKFSAQLYMHLGKIKERSGILPKKIDAE